MSAHAAATVARPIADAASPQAAQLTRWDNGAWAAVDWGRQFEAHLPLVDRAVRVVVRRYGVSHDRAEDFRGNVILKLIEDDYRVLRAFRGASTLGTYLVTVATRLLLDERIAAQGKWRPSAAARRLGPVAMRLERLRAIDGLSSAQAARVIAHDPGVGLSESELLRMAEALPQRVVRRTSDIDVETLAAGPQAWGDAGLLAAEQDEALVRLRTALRRGLRSLSPEERTLIDLRVRNGLQVAAIARHLGTEQKPLYRRLERVLRRLRRTLEEAGFTDTQAGRQLVNIR